MSGLLPEFNLMKWLSLALMACLWIPSSKGQAQSVYLLPPQDPGRSARKAYDAALEAYRFHAPTWRWNGSTGPLRRPQALWMRGF